MSAIGENIRRLREQNGYSQTKLAENVGVTRAAISQYENGITMPRMGVIERMSRLFGVPKSEIVDTQIEYAVIDLKTNDEMELVELFRALPSNGRRALLAGLREYVNH